MLLCVCMLCVYAHIYIYTHRMRACIYTYIYTHTRLIRNRYPIYEVTGIPFSDIDNFGSFCMPGKQKMVSICA